MICDGTLYGIRPLVACLPAWFRFAQCLRRYKDTRQAFPHLVNAGKYSTAFFVVAFSTLGNLIVFVTCNVLVICRLFTMHGVAQMRDPYISISPAVESDYRIVQGRPSIPFRDAEGSSPHSILGC